MCLIGCDQLGDCTVVDQYLHYCAPSATVRCLDKYLRHDCLEAHCEESFSLLAQLARQSVDNSIDRFNSARGVKCAEHEVTGLCSGHRHRNCLGIAKLANKNDIRVLAHGRAHAVGKRCQVCAKLALNNLAFFAGMHEFDRVFETNDVEITRFIEVIDHRRKRGRLTRAG